VKKLLPILIVVLLILAFCSPALARVTEVTAWVNDPVAVGNAYKFTFGGQIYTDRGGDINYRWARSDNANPPVKTLHASGPGLYTVEQGSWQLGSRWSGQTFSVTLEVIHPSTISSDPVSFTVP
jgi:hypothetical protein